MAGGDGFECGLELGVGLGAGQFRRLDERGDTTPRGGAFVEACEQCVFSRQGNRPREILDGIAMHLDAPVGKEELEAVPVSAILEHGRSVHLVLAVIREARFRR